MCEDLFLPQDRDDAHSKPSFKENPSWLDSGRDQPTATSRSSKSRSGDDHERRVTATSHRDDSDESEDNDDGGSFPGLDAEQFATDMMDLACVVCKWVTLDIYSYFLTS